MQTPIINKRAYHLLMLAFGILAIFIYVHQINTVVSSTIEPPHIEAVAPIELEAPAPPQTLLIPKIGVDTHIESVGVTNEGKMGLPDVSTNVAWYKFGTTPGATGNAVIAGHLDNFLGRPLVFWRLDELEVGDAIYVITEDGTELRYRVTGKALYDHNALDTEDIFGPTDKQQLNLITCDGMWLRDIRNYDKRLVIFSEAF